MTTEAEFPRLYRLEKVEGSKTLTGKIYRVCFLCDHDGSTVETSVLKKLPRTWTKGLTCIVDFTIGFLGGLQNAGVSQDPNVIIGTYAGGTMLGKLRTMLPTDAHPEIWQALAQPQNSGWKDQMTLVKTGNVSAWVKNENVSKWQEGTGRSVPVSE